MPVLTSRCLQNVASQGFSESFYNGRPSISSIGQRSNQFSTGRRNSTWDPLIHHSPLKTVEDSLDLTKGIKGITIGKQLNDDDTPVAPLICGTQSTTKSRLPRLCVNDHGRRKDHQIMKMKTTINNEQMKGKSSGNKREPLDCFIITSLNYKHACS